MSIQLLLPSPLLKMNSYRGTLNPKLLILYFTSDISLEVRTMLYKLICSSFKELALFELPKIFINKISPNKIRMESSPLFSLFLLCFILESSLWDKSSIIFVFSFSMSLFCFNNYVFWFYNCLIYSFFLSLDIWADCLFFCRLL